MQRFFRHLVNYSGAGRLLSAWRGHRTQDRPICQRQRTPLQLEALEDRTVPATIEFTYNVGAGPEIGHVTYDDATVDPTLGTQDVAITDLAINYYGTTYAVAGSRVGNVAHLTHGIYAGADFVFGATALGPVRVSGTAELVDVTLPQAGNLVVFDDLPVQVLTQQVTVERVSNAIEGGANGLLRFTRTGNTSSALTVTFEVSGTATEGVDYDTLPQSVTFAAGQTEVLLDLVPLGDTAQEPTETVLVTLDSDAAYQIVGSPTAGVNLGMSVEEFQARLVQSIEIETGVAIEPAPVVPFDPALVLTEAAAIDPALLTQAQSDLDESLGWSPTPAPFVSLTTVVNSVVAYNAAIPEFATAAVNIRGQEIPGADITQAIKDLIKDYRVLREKMRYLEAMRNGLDQALRANKVVIEYYKQLLVQASAENPINAAKIAALRATIVRQIQLQTTMLKLLTATQNVIIDNMKEQRILYYNTLIPALGVVTGPKIVPPPYNPAPLDSNPVDYLP